MLERKRNHLRKILKDMGRVLIAYSGGVDSTYLLAEAKDVLGDQVIAVTAKSETYVQNEYEKALKIVDALGMKHIVIETKELDYPNYSQNPINRCYYCKKELFHEVREVAQKYFIQWIADGSNADDNGDFRPGIKALREQGVRSPLMEAGLTKNEIRALSKKLKLPTWDKPAVACLGSRFPYGSTITREKLKMIEQAETFLHGLGIKQLRIRHHENMARIEVLPEDIPRLIGVENRKKIVERLKQIGYHYIAVDLEGYRAGSMNEVLVGQNKLTQGIL